MWHRLALSMGIPVDMCRQVISSSEFTHWIAYYAVEPWGYEIENWRAATIAATVAQSSGAKVKLADFLPNKTESISADPVEVATKWMEALSGQHRDDQISAAS